jgi:receptor protein-tyrosine kinase
MRRRRAAILLALAIPVAVAVALTATTKKVYEGTALVVINRQSLAQELTNSPNPSAASSTYINIVTTYADAANSTQVADRVAKAVPDAKMTGSQLLSQSTITPLQDADVVKFMVRNHDAALAQQLASEFASQFVSYELDLNISALGVTLDQIDARLRQARSRHDTALASSLADRDEQLRTLSSLQTANNYVINPTASASVASPRPALDVGLGILGGIVLAAVLVTALEGLDTRVRSVDEVHEVLDAPLLGRIGPPRKPDRERVLSLADPADVGAEAFRILRTSLALQTLHRDGKVVMITSAVEREGKSLTIANLAVASARAGERVILIDMNLRHPTQDMLFDTGGREPGLTNVLLGSDSLEDALLQIPIDGDERRQPAGDAGDGEDGAAGEGAGGDGPRVVGSLRLLRSGPVPADPGQLVASQQIANLIAQLRGDADVDVIYVDAPPVLGAGDAMAISRFADVLFLVTQLPRLRRPMLVELVRTLDTSPAFVAGFVATGKRASIGTATTASRLRPGSAQWGRQRSPSAPG